MMASDDLERVSRALQAASRVVLTTHVNPDGDALGSELALGRFLKGLGKDVTILNHDATPAAYQFLDEHGLLTQYDANRHADLVSNADAVVVLDANQISRIGSLEGPVSSCTAVKLCIDHHQDAQAFADIMIVDPHAAATAVLVYQLLVRMGGSSIGKHIADPLYVAIMTDTGSFRFPSTDASLHHIVAQLIVQGADPARLYQRVYEENPPRRIRLMGMVLATLETLADGRIAYLTATREMFSGTGTSESDTENFINHTLSIRGVVIGLMFTELPGLVKISFRSKGNIPVNKLAQQLGGNGHLNAAGARVGGEPLERVVPRVLEAATNFLDA